MLEETATVVSSSSQGLWVETQARSSCSSCSSTTCTTSVVSKLFGMRRNRFFVASNMDLAPGQSVVIGISDEVLVKASLLAYLGPLVTMIGAASVAGLAGLGEGLQGLAAVSGLGLGFLGLKRLATSARLSEGFEPRLLRVGNEQVGIEVSLTVRS